VFTGIVEELGRFRGADGGRFTFDAGAVLRGTRAGDSVSVNGCCLTVVEVGEGWWRADVVEETLRRTTLGGLAPGDPVNLERALRLDDRLGGHLVQGHVDGVGTVTAAPPDLAVRPPAGLLRYIAEKGSVALDGVSLTVARVVDDAFTIAVIPHTAAATTLGTRRAGDPVNIEVDLIARYVARLLGE
jgi:riboflavin synthase